MAKTTTTTETTEEVLLKTEIVPGVTNALVPLDELDAKDQERIDRLMTEIDPNDSTSIIYFGTKAQQELTELSDRMLEGVRNKDTGAAGSALSEMVLALRGFDVEKLNPNEKPSWFARLLGFAKPVAKFLQKYEEVRNQIDAITDKLERHKTQLLTDITSLDRLYDANLDYFHNLEDYIHAGEKKLLELDNEVIPAFAKEVEAAQDMLKSQELKDLRSARDDLERRVHDLKLTRQVIMQALPSIRLVQDNDKGLVTKINSTIANTIPLWRQQLAQTVTIYRSAQAGKTVKAANDLTNELLESGAETLKQANAEVRTQIERGIFDIEAVKKANQTLIETIQESLQIADDAKKRRAEAEQQLVSCEDDLKEALAAASAGQISSTRTASE
ncbi:MAG: tellurium resistance protein [Lysobacteraceae bacterium]|nr:MAG: tellurium resistance protein [Xanthomonadaceae bacterium]